MKLYSYTIYNDDGTIKEIPARPKMQLKELQAAVGGLIEILPDYLANGKLEGSFTAFCNEEGKLLGLAPNPHFQQVTIDGSLTWDGQPWTDWVTGNVIVERTAKEKS
jgi:hypothetical protein